jgi:hypothetical protein
MNIICFNNVKIKNGPQIFCGAIQMTGYDGSKHTLRQDLPCRGCGQVGHYDGFNGVLESNQGHLVVNGHVEPVREL